MKIEMWRFGEQKFRHKMVRCYRFPALGNMVPLDHCVSHMLFMEYPTSIFLLYVRIEQRPLQDYDSKRAVRILNWRLGSLCEGWRHCRFAIASCDTSVASPPSTYVKSNVNSD